MQSNIFGGQEDLSSLLNTYTTHQPESLTLDSRPRGRITKEETHFLNRFIRRGKRPLKKENLRIWLIRSHKKTNRALARDLPAPVQSDAPSAAESEILHRLRTVIARNPDLFRGLSDTGSGPQTEAQLKSARHNRRSHPRARSFNNSYCAEYFEEWLVRESFYFFIELLFVDLCPTKLAARFKVNCCLELQHSSACLELWMELKQFVQYSILEEIGVWPFEPEDSDSFKESILF